MNKFIPKLPIDPKVVDGDFIEQLQVHILALVLAKYGVPAAEADNLLSDVVNANQNPIVKTYCSVESFLEMVEVIKPLPVEKKYETLVEVWVFLEFKKVFSYHPIFNCDLNSKSHDAVIQFAEDYINDDFVNSI